MGEESTSNDNNANNNNNGSSYESPVILNVYDLTPANQYTVWFGFGIFHSGVEGAFCSCLLPESLQVTTVKQLPEYHLCAEEDESGSMSTATPHEPTESEDGDQDKHLLSPPVGSREVAFIRETPRSNVLPE
uniref:DeSI-like protein At4g17486 n=1 Tax=Nicotiana tabacum TaxID=4097 RepID=A0A1S3WXT3_TOBAC|nr:PREDICTED: deSI-like protein At4g17486 [Nicotiana tabacum]